MGTLKKCFKTLQIETLILIALPITWILISSFYKSSLLSILSEGRLELLRWSFFYGGYVIFWGLSPLYVYFYFKLLVSISRWVSRRVFNDKMSSPIKVKKFAFSFLYLFIALGISNLALALSLLQIANISSEANMISASNLYMSMDKSIFGVIPEIWIQKLSQSHLLDYILIESYCKLCLCFTIVFLGLLLFKRQYFRKYVVAFFIVPFLAMPLWYVLPAVTPNEMYRENMFSLSSVSPIQRQFETSIKSDKLKKFLNFLEKNKQEPVMVSTNPSMHVAWGILITYFAIALWWPLGFIFIPWLIFNMISTIYTMQHYVVDLPTAIICAALAIIITNYLFKVEGKYYSGSYNSLYFIKVIQSDIKLLKSKLTSRFLRH